MPRKPKQKPKQQQRQARPSAALEGLVKQAFADYQQGRLDPAEARCRQVLKLDPGNTFALQILGLVAKQRGQLPRAEDLIRQALAINRKDPQALNTLGAILAEQGKTVEAVGTYKKALRLAPAYATAHNNLGNALAEQGKYRDAVARYHRAIQLEPRDPNSYFNLGNALRALGENTQAIDNYRQALSLNAGFPPAYTNLAVLLHRQGNAEEAIALNERALQIDPKSYQAHNNLGTLLLDQGRIDAAVNAFRRSLAINANNAEARNNLGLALHMFGQRQEAEAAFRQALTLEPRHVGALSNLAQLCTDRGDVVAAVELLQLANAADPDDMKTLTSLFSLAQRRCHWEEVEIRAKQIDVCSRKNPGGIHMPDEPPLLNVGRCDDPARNLAVARAWSDAIEKRMSAARATTRFDHKPRQNDKLRLGYLSQDFRDHPVGHLVHSLFAQHDRGQFEIHGYSYGPDDGSDYRASIAAGFDIFADVREESHLDAARRIHADGVDILIDLTGHTKNSRLEICALRPAPLQATYLGFPGGSGAGFIDYMITDRIVTPADHATFYREKLAILPHAYQANDRWQVIGEKPASRAETGLPEDAFVFACFNQTAKIDSVMFDTWMQIVAAVPGSILWLLDGPDGTVAETLRREAEARQVDGNRLIFAPRLAKAAHLARLRLADLVLDTRIYNGHTTTSDALWAGVPVVALLGGHFASRVSASLLTAIGLDDLIATDIAAYARLAIDLARNPDELQNTRDRLWQNRMAQPLFDTPALAKDLEQLYRRMWDNYLAGRGPRQIVLAP